MATASSKFLDSPSQKQSMESKAFGSPRTAHPDGPVVPLLLSRTDVAGGALGGYGILTATTFSPSLGMNLDSDPNATPAGPSHSIGMYDQLIRSNYYT